MERSWMRPLIGVLVAIAITTAMDANGLLEFSALPLAGLLGLFWFLDRCSRTEIGFVWGSLAHYGLALLHPALIIGLITAAAWIGGAIDVGDTDWNKAWLNLALLAVATTLAAIITEEGFFHGWLWAALQRRDRGTLSTLLWSSLAFAAWHISAVMLDTEFAPLGSQVPLYLVNAAVMGAIWGMLRLISGSVLVASVGHGVWNGFAYVFFGFGTKTGALGIVNTALYGPEVGWMGLGLNVLFVLGLWHWHRRANAPASTVSAVG
jgi:membrane protease YdiL (CAAX protease family)